MKATEKYEIWNLPMQNNVRNILRNDKQDLQQKMFINYKF